MIGRIDIEHTDELLVAIEAIEAFVEKCPDRLWRAKAAGFALLEKLSESERVACDFSPLPGQ